MEQIQQLKEQIKLLEQQELEKKIAEEKKDDIEYNLEIVNKILNNYKKQPASRSCNLRSVISECNQLYEVVSQMCNIMVQMNKEITELKNTKYTHNITL